MESYKDLAVAALVEIEMHPERWNQRHWRCSTGACLAGTMVELSSTAKWDRPSVVDDSHVVDQSKPGKYFTPCAWAVDALRMPARDAMDLFASENGMDELRAGVKALLNDQPVGDAIWQVRIERTEAAIERARANVQRRRQLL